MGGRNEILVGRYNRYVQRLLGIKGGPPTPSVSSDLQPVLDLSSGDIALEERYLAGWDVFAGFKNWSPLAANNAYLELRNPEGSNVIAAIHRWNMWDAAADTNVDLQLHTNPTADQGTVVTSAALDRRGRPGSSCILTCNSGAAATPPGGTVQALANYHALRYQVIEFLRESEELLLLPGQALLVKNETADNTISSLWWHERYLEESERL